MKSLPSLFSLAVCILLSAGCASVGYKKAGNASTSLHDAAQGIDNSLAPLDDALAALTDLVNNPAENITPQFQKYSSAVSRLESLSNDVNTQAVAMQVQGDDYFKKWDTELAKIQSGDIHTRSLDRKNTVAARFEKVRVSYVKTQTNFAPFMSDLIDIRTALAMDLTAGGLNSIQGLARKANDNALPLRESLVELSADFRRLGISISPGTPVE